MKSKIWIVIGYLLFAGFFIGIGVVGRQQYEKIKEKVEGRNRHQVKVENLPDEILAKIELNSRAPGSRSGFEQVEGVVYNGTAYRVSTIIVTARVSDADGKTISERLLRLSSGVESLSTMDYRLRVPGFTEGMTCTLKVASAQGSLDPTGSN